MGRLSGHSYRNVIKVLKKSGFIKDIFKGKKGSHEIWFHPDTKKTTTVSKHKRDISEGTLHSILKKAGITPDEFLKILRSQS